MPMVHILGYICAVVIGIAMGLIGGGGTILTVPVLVYIFGVDTRMASGYSMFIVGVSSLVGSITYLKNKLVDMRITAMFGIPALIMVFVSRLVILKALPETLISSGGYTLTKDTALMVLFALLMVTASYIMLAKKDYVKPDHVDENLLHQAIELGTIGGIIGLLGGLLGAGGGFLIVPALVSFSGLPVKKAIGTSLLIISVNLSLGFISVLIGKEPIQWAFMLTFAGLAILGIMLGSYFSNFIPGRKLKPAFGVFILLMGIYILGKELIGKK